MSPAPVSVPFFRLDVTHESFEKEFLADVQQLLRDCDFIGPSSKKHGQFECDFAGYIGTKYALGVNSGTDALIVPLHALGFQPGDEVIMAAFGFIATADIVVRLGGKPVFVDIDPVTYNIDASQIEGAITPRTKAIIPVHLYGQSTDMDAVMAVAAKHGIPVIEDVAQAAGVKWGERRAGSIGVAGAFSFYPTKNIGAAGDAGIITTNDDALAETMMKYRDHGRDRDGSYACIGYNTRLDTIQALYLAHKLPELDDLILERIENARLYNKLFAESELTLPAIPEDESHTFNLYTIRVRDRDRLQNYLKEKGIGSAVYYKEAMHLTRALEHLGYREGQFPEAERAVREVLSLPIWPGLKKREIEEVASTVLAFLDNNSAALSAVR